MLEDEDFAMYQCRVCDAVFLTIGKPKYCPKCGGTYGYPTTSQEMKRMLDKEKQHEAD